MRRDRFDLAVLGAGPGGAACALAAAHSGLDVVVFEPLTGRAGGAGADKPCGEGILPPGVEALRALDLEEVLGGGVAFDTIRYVAPGAPPLDVPLGAEGIALPRPRLQATLDDALHAQPNVRRVAWRATAERRGHGDGFLVRAGDEVFHARTLAAADGAFGRSAPWLERRGAPDEAGARRLGLRVRARARAALETVEVHIGRGPEIYLTPLPDGLVNAAVLFSDAPSEVRGSAALLELALDAYPEVRERLGEIVTPPACRRLGAPARRPAADATFAVGDAGGGVDPILGCGVSIALCTGMLAAECAGEVVAGGAAGRAERRYARAYAAQTTRRRRLASFLRTISRHAWSARAVVALGRVAPAFTASMVRIASAA